MVTLHRDVVQYVGATICLGHAMKSVIPGELLVGACFKNRMLDKIAMIYYTIDTSNFIWCTEISLG